MDKVYSLHAPDTRFGFLGILSSSSFDLTPEASHDYALGVSLVLRPNLLGLEILLKLLIIRNTLVL